MRGGEGRRRKERRGEERRREREEGREGEGKQTPIPSLPLTPPPYIHNRSIPLNMGRLGRFLLGERGSEGR